MTKSKGGLEVGTSVSPIIPIPSQLDSGGAVAYLTDLAGTSEI